MKEKIKIKRSEVLKHVPNKMHLNAQIMFPARIQKDRSKFDRNAVKRNVQKEIY